MCLTLSYEYKKVNSDSKRVWQTKDRENTLNTFFQMLSKLYRNTSDNGL